MIHGGGFDTVSLVTLGDFLLLLLWLFFLLVIFAVIWSA